MRVLIVGGGIAGLTLAAKLRRQGREPVVVEKAPVYGDVGYGLGLYPMGSCVLHGLGAHEEFMAAGRPVESYRIADHRGEVLQDADMVPLTGEVGAVMMIERREMVDILVRAAGEVDMRMGSTVEAIEQDGATVTATLSDGTEEACDLLVGADGIHSQVRDLVLGPQDPFDTGWVFWTWWIPAGDWPAGVVQEAWGAGRFFGAYPCAGRTMVGAGFPAADDPGVEDDVPAARAFLSELLGDLIAADPFYARAVDAASSFFRWPMTDVRSASWVEGRVALCGDAAAAFLPTAGVGASNALRAAAGLADELSRVDASTVPLALELYEKRCREVVEGNQQDSRKAARLMFVEHGLTTWARDRVVEHYPVAKVLGEIVEASRTPF